MTESNESLFERAAEVIPGGVNSPVRAFGSVGGIPVLRRPRRAAPTCGTPRARSTSTTCRAGARRSSATPTRSIVAAVTGRRRRRHVVRRADRARDRAGRGDRDRVPAVDMVRLVSSGTEAAMTAVRLARGVTGPQPIVKFAGCYHGHSDALLAAGGQRRRHARAPRARPAYRSRRWPRRRRALQRGARARRAAWPCVIVEPVAANMGLVRARRRASSRGCARACDARRRAADLRRGDHRVPARPAAARSRAHRRPPRPVDVRQGHRRRPARRRVRRPPRRHGPARPARARVPGRARCRGTRSPPRPGSPCWASSTTPPTSASLPMAFRLAAGLRADHPRGGRRRARAGRRTLSGCSSPHGPSATTTRRARRRQRDRTRGSSTPCSTAAWPSRRARYEALFPSLAHTDDDIARTLEGRSPRCPCSPRASGRRRRRLTRAGAQSPGVSRAMAATAR